MRSHAKASSAGSNRAQAGDRGSPRTHRKLLVLLLFACASFCAFPGSALAVESRSVIEAFGPDGTAATSFESPAALAIDQGSHRLYALDQVEQKIHGFSIPSAGIHTLLAGNFPLTAPGAGFADDIAADDSSHNLYYASEGGNELYGFDESGAALTGFPVGGHNFPCGTAVDSNGDIWVSEGNEGKVQKYSPAGALLETVSVGGEPCDLGFDSADNLYVGFFFGPTKKYTAATDYATSSTIDSEFTSAMTVNRSTSEIYVIHYNYIDAWAANGEFLYELKGEGFGGEFAGMAIDEATEELYVADYGNHKVQVYGPPIFPPTVTAQEADGIEGDEATLHGTVNPKEQALTDCHFQFVPDAQFKADGYESATPSQEAPCEPDFMTIPADSSPHAVSAQISGLEGPSKAYHFHLIAGNAVGLSTSADRILFTPGAAPAVSAQSVEAVGTNDAILSAKVNPHGAQTTYRVEYGTTTAYGASTAESAPIGFPSDNDGHLVSVHIDGLNPGTAYHFHFVASNEAGDAEGTDVSFATYPAAPSFGSCGNDGFRTGFGARLPDCRAYEQVTPTDKHGANIQGTKNAVQASTSGDRITFYLNGGLPTTGGSARLAAYMASRGATGWSTDGLLPQSAPGRPAFISGWDEDLAEAVVIGRGLNGTDFAVYMRDSATASFQLIGTGEYGETPAFAGSAADHSHVIFEMTALKPLLAEAPPNQVVLYDFNHGALTLPGRVPASGTSCDDNNGPACVLASGESYAGSYEWYPAGGGCSGGISDGGAYCGYYTQATNTISRDGSKVFFTDGSTKQLYVREDGVRTRQVSASQASVPDPHGPKPAAFLYATPDASKVLFLSCEKLTDDSTAVSNGEEKCNTANQGQDLYSYDPGTGDLTDLTVDANPGDAKGTAVIGFLGASEDGSYIYFVANGVLAPGASPGDCVVDSEGSQKTCSIYMLHDGVTTFVAPASGGDQSDWLPSSKVGVGSEKISRVADDGSLLFGSHARLTDYDSTEAAATDCPESSCSEFYRYSPSNGEIVCVSCNPTGAPPNSTPSLQSTRGFIFDAPREAILTRNLSADGNRVFFGSVESLVPTDTNGVDDVYEWEAEGSGSCHTSGGCLYLVSTGTSPDPSYFGDASANGDHVYVFTSQQLVPGDKDELIDVYDAGVGDGLASQHELTPPTCTGTACQANPAPPPDQTLSSAAFSGPGNAKAKPAARKCGKGQRKVRRAGKVRCQKAHKATKQHKRHSNRGGSK